MDIADVWDADVYLASLDPHSTKAQCLRYLIDSDVPRESVDRACQRGMLNEADARRQQNEREREVAQQPSHRAAWQGPGPIGTVAVGAIGALSLASTDPPLRSFFTWDDPWHKWRPWFLGFKVLGCVAFFLLCWWFCVSV